MKTGGITWLILILSGILYAQNQTVSPNPLSGFFPDTILSPYPVNTINHAKAAVYRLDSIYILNWKVSDSTWGNSQSTLFIFDGLNRIDHEMSRYWNGSNWTNMSLNKREYGPDGNISRLIHQVWQKDQWKNHSQNLYFYRSNGTLEHYVVQLRDASDTGWINQIRYEYGFDNEGNWTSYVRKNWNADSLIWINDYRFLYSYQKSLKTEMIRQNWLPDSLEWINNTQTLYVYDSNGAVINEFNNIWDSDSLLWDFSTKIIFDYDQGKVTRKTYRIWRNNQWENSVQYTYTYSLGQNDQIIYFIWNKSSSSWEENRRYLYTYHDPLNLSSEIWQSRNASTSSWDNDLQIKYFYSLLKPLLSVTITDSSNISCYGEDDGWAVAAATGGTPPYSYLWDDPKETTDSVVNGLQAGRYYHITVIDADSSIAVDSIILSQPGPVITGPITGDTIVSGRDTSTYSVQPTPGSVYTWQVCGGEIVSGQGTASIRVYWTECGCGCISVIETDSSGCSGSRVYLNVQITPVGTNLLPQVRPVHFFPNPFTNELILELPGLQPNEKCTFQIFDLNGKMIRDMIITEKRNILRLSNLSPGFYIAKIHYRNRPFFQKLVKK